MNKIIILTIMVSLFLINCAGTNGSGPKVRDHRVSIGLATNEDFVTLANRVLNRHRFVIEQTEDRGAGTVIICQYVYPNITNLEILNGINEVRYQLMLESRVKGNGAGMYSVRAIVKSFGRPEGSEEWIDVATNDETKKRIKDFSNDLKIEFENRIRAF